MFKPEVGCFICVVTPSFTLPLSHTEIGIRENIGLSLYLGMVYVVKSVLYKYRLMHASVSQPPYGRNRSLTLYVSSLPRLLVQFKRLLSSSQKN